MAFLLIIILAIILFWPYISRWVARFAAHRMEDMVRRQFGMPSRKEEEQARKRQDRRESQTGHDSQHRQSGQKRRYSRYTGNRQGSPIIPPEYAEDIEFTETIDYSEETVAGSDGKSTRVYHESQVSDVQYVEIKDK